MKTSLLSRYGSSVPSSLSSSSSASSLAPSLFYGSGIPGDMSGLPGVFFSPGDDGGSGGGNGAGGDNGGNDNGGAGGNGGGSDENDDPAKLFTPEQQAVFNRAQNKLKNKYETDIAAIRAQAEDNARKKIEEADQKAKEAAQRKRDEEQGEWQKVADGRKAEIEGKQNEIATLTPKAELADKLVKMFNDQIETKIKDWHPEVKELDPGAENIEARMKWLPIGEKQQSRYEILSKNYDTDLGKSGSGGVSSKQAVEQSRQSLASSGRY